MSEYERDRDGLIFWTDELRELGRIAESGQRISTETGRYYDAREVVSRFLDSDWLTAHDARIASEAAERAWDERDGARPTYGGPDGGHYEDCIGYEDCYCATYPNPYRADRLANAREGASHE